MEKKLLEGKKGIITGALNSSSLAWKVAERCFEEGAKFVLTNTAYALEKGQIKELAKKTNSEIIIADLTNLEDIKNLFQKSVEILGGKIDFLLHSVAMSYNIKEGLPYPGLNYDYFLKTLDISALSLHKLLSCGWRLNALAEGGSIVTISYIASQRFFPNYSDMAEAKAMLESIVRSFGYYLGKEKKIRINTISQSPTKTTAASGIKGFEAFYEYAQAVSPLGNASAESLADLAVVLFSDLTRGVTMQTIYNDGGFSATGVSEEVLKKFLKENLI